jgi:hypothetical protein
MLRTTAILLWHLKSAKWKLVLTDRARRAIEPQAEQDRIGATSD